MDEFDRWGRLSADDLSARAMAAANTEEALNRLLSGTGNRDLRRAGWSDFRRQRGSRLTLVSILAISAVVGIGFFVLNSGASRSRTLESPSSDQSDTTSDAPQAPVPEPTQSSQVVMVVPPQPIPRTAATAIETSTTPVTPSTDPSTVPSPETVEPIGPFTTEILSNQSLSDDELKHVRLVNRCAQKITIADARPETVIDPPAFFVQSRFWLRYGVSGQMLTLTFFDAGEPGPPTVPVDVVDLAPNRQASVGSYEGSLIALISDVVPGCPTTQILTSTSDIDQFEAALRRITVSD